MIVIFTIFQLLQSKIINRQLQIGLTGGIGSGKSIVGQLFSVLGIPVFISDIEAAKLMMLDKYVIGRIKKEFGKRVFRGQRVDRKKLASIVFDDDKKLKKLNAIMHPAVKRSYAKWLKEHGDSDYIIKEAAILIESGVYKALDKIILVTAPQETRIRRVLKREGMTRKDVLARMKNQWSDEKKKKYADYIIGNDGKSLILPMVLKLHKQLLSKKGNR